MNCDAAPAAVVPIPCKIILAKLFVHLLMESEPMRVAGLLFALSLAPAAHAQMTAERAFEQARQWTVVVRTSIDRAFIEDEQGSLMGSGLIIDATRGWVLTNAHVASHSYSSNTVMLAGGKPLPAQRVYVDPYVDIAILAYDPGKVATSIPVPTLKCDGSPAVGHPVGAFGHPWGFRFTGTRGIASAVTTRLGPAMLQTDAPINSGNSGGPLISLETGAVVGINAASMRKDRSEGLSFAVPATAACRILDLMRTGRDPSPPARLLDFAVDENNERTLVIARSRLTAGQMDLRVGDQIVGIGNPSIPLASESNLTDALRGQLDAVVLQVQRNGAPVTVRGTWPRIDPIVGRRALWVSGAMFAASETGATALLKDSPALMIHHIEPGSEAQNGDLRPFDLLISADGASVGSLAELDSAATRARTAGRPLNLILLRIASEGEAELFLHQQRLLNPTEIEQVGPDGASTASVVAP